MDYREDKPGSGLDGLVKARWTLSAPEDADRWLTQHATPDGCVEIIRRLTGRSRWNGDQPDVFAVGLIDRPTAFEVSSDSRFEGLRLWPWAWPLVSDIPLRALRARWLPFAAPSFAAIEARLVGETALNAFGRAIVGADSVAAMAAATGLGYRTLQRWFAGKVGMSPRAYLRLLRFQRAFATAPGQASLAGHAADTGFADQAHMARDFRALAGISASTARQTAVGPFRR